MGLLYPFPISEKESDHVEVQDQTLTLRSYGLPLLFWGYLMAILSILLIMYLAIQDPLAKLRQMEDVLNMALAYSVYVCFALIPLSLLAFFFYEKVLMKKKNSLIIIHKIFYIPFLKQHLELTGDFSIRHFLASPNIARQKDDPKMQAFQNRGHFHLYGMTLKGEKIIDRHSQKRELEKLRDLLKRW